MRIPSSLGIVIGTASALALAVGAGAAPAKPGTGPNYVDEPQPHLERARELAAKEPGWRHPGLIPCYRHEGNATGGASLANPLPRRIFDNLWYVGNGGYGPYIVKTSAGLILLDAMSNQYDIQRGLALRMQAAGLNPADIKIVIVTHGHPDHYGGAKYIQEKYKARVYMAPADWDWSAILQKDPREQKGFGPVPDRDLDVVDGGKITLGDTTIRTWITPGHTPGTLSMLIPVTENGKSYTIAHISGITSKGLSAVLHHAFDASAARFQKIMRENKVDGFISSHPNYDDAVYKIALMDTRPDDPNPFLIGTDNTVLFMDIVRQCNLNNADLEARGLDGSGGGFNPTQPDYKLGPDGW